VTQPLKVGDLADPQAPERSERKNKKWSKYTDKKKWGKVLSAIYLTTGFVFAALFVVQLGLTFGLANGPVIGVTTDYTMYDPAPPGTFAPVLATPYTMPIDYIWITAYGVASIASFLMYAMRKRIWAMLVGGQWASAVWVAMSTYYAFTTLAVVGTIGITNIFILILATVIAAAVCVFNGAALNYAAHPDRASDKKHSTGTWMMECCSFFMAFSLSAVLIAAGWTYYGYMILTVAAYAASSAYILATLIVYSFVLLVRFCLICWSLYWYRKSMSKNLSEEWHLPFFSRAAAH
jgi:hypothetical protein